MRLRQNGMSGGCRNLYWQAGHSSMHACIMHACSTYGTYIIEHYILKHSRRASSREGKEGKKGAFLNIVLTLPPPHSKKLEIFPNSAVEKIDFWPVNSIYLIFNSVPV